MTFTTLKSIPKPNSYVKSNSIWISSVSKAAKVSEYAILNALAKLQIQAEQLYDNETLFNEFSTIINQYPNYTQRIEYWRIFRGKSISEMVQLRKQSATKTDKEFFLFLGRN